MRRLELGCVDWYVDTVTERRLLKVLVYCRKT